MREVFRFVVGLVVCLVLLTTSVSGYSIRSDASYNTSTIENVVIHTPSQRVYPSAEFNITFYFNGHETPLKLALNPNHDILFQAPHINFLDSNGRSTQTELVKRNNHRIFRGAVFAEGITGWKNVGWARINILRDGPSPLFTGAFTIHGTEYDLKAISDQTVISYRTDDGLPTLPSNITTPAHHYLTPQKRQFTLDADDFVSTIGDASGCPGTRQIALVGIATDCAYTATFSSREELVNTLITMVNTASEIFESTFNIALALHNLTIEEEGCPRTPSSDLPWNAGCGAGDLNWRLDQFSQWRATISDSENAYWTLMTGCPTGTEVGVSWVGQLCDEQTGTNVVGLAQNQWQVFAHETGHTFGAYHDCDSATCSFGQQCCPFSSSSCDANGQYIMNPISASSQQEFSQCTIGNVCSSLGSGRVRTSCLTTNADTPTISAGECGNGIVEVGEECDCGDECEGNPCCDGATCRFLGDAECDDSSGGCCNNCRFAARGTVCRAAVSECDVEETCPGDDGICPEDEFRRDGETCGDDEGGDRELFCSSGQCTNRDMQCQAQFDNATTVESCGNGTCFLECSGSWTGSGSCSRVGNVLDGTPCDGGICRSGICRSNTRDDDGESWVQRNLSLVIGLSAGIGGLLLLSLLSCIVYCCCCRRRPKTIQPLTQTPLRPMPGYPGYTGYQPPPAYTPRPVHPTPYFRYA